MLFDNLLAILLLTLIYIYLGMRVVLMLRYSKELLNISH